MVGFAAEMQRQGLTIPLLIGGATTSRAHTAVKVDQRYDGPVVWVKDASRSVPTAAALLSDELRPKLMAQVKEDYDSLRARHAGQGGPAAARPRRRPGSGARRSTGPATVRRTRTCCSSRTTTSRRSPARTGSSQHVKVFHDYPLGELRRYIDWQPFFNAWEMKGSFPDILNNPASGQAARKLYDDAQAMLDRIIEERWLTRQRRHRLLPRQLGGRRRRGLPRRRRAPSP